MPKKKTRLLILITACLLAIAGAGSFYMLFRVPPGRIAKIYQNNALLYEIDLNEVKESYTIAIEGEYGYHNIVLVEPGQISMETATCPDQTCVRTGRIGSGALPVVCLPNHVVIVIESGEEESYDVQVY